MKITNYMFMTALVGAVMFVSALTADAQRLFVKSGPGLWAVGVPNLAAEYVLREDGRISVGAGFAASGNVAGAYLDDNYKVKMTAFQPVFKYYFGFHTYKGFNLTVPLTIMAGNVVRTTSNVPPLVITETYDYFYTGLGPALGARANIIKDYFFFDFSIGATVGYVDMKYTTNGTADDIPDLYLVKDITTQSYSARGIMPMPKAEFALTFRIY